MAFNLSVVTRAPAIAPTPSVATLEPTSTEAAAASFAPVTDDERRRGMFDEPAQGYWTGGGAQERQFMYRPEDMVTEGFGQDTRQRLSGPGEWISGTWVPATPLSLTPLSIEDRVRPYLPEGFNQSYIPPHRLSGGSSNWQDDPRVTDPRDLPTIQRNLLLQQAQSDALYHGDVDLVQRLARGEFGDPLTEQEVQQWFGPDAIQYEIARIRESQGRDRGTFGNAAYDFREYIPMLAMATLGSMLPGAFSGMLGAGAGGATGAELAALIESGATGAAGGAMEAAALGGAGGVLGGLTQPISQIASGTLLSGGDLEQALKNYALGQGVGFGADVAAPIASEALSWLSGPGQTVPVRGAMPAAVPEVDPTFGGALTETAPGMFTDIGNAAAFGTLAPALGTQPAPALPAEQPGAVTGQDIQRYAKLAQTVNQLFGDTPQGAPQRGEGQSDAEYADQLVSYLGLDAATMAEAGLTPGTPEYYEYIMAQADSVIAQVLGDTDVDAADLAQQLRSKTQEELLALQRALFVRGQMEQLMGSGMYVDPATGRSVEVLGDELFNPAAGAYQRGLARDVEELAGLRGEEAAERLGGMLSRDVDFFGMQEAQDARLELARRNAEDELRRRRGMFSTY